MSGQSCWLELTDQWDSQEKPKTVDKLWDWKKRDEYKNFPSKKSTVEKIIAEGVIPEYTTPKNFGSVRKDTPSQAFTRTHEWRELRQVALDMYGSVCMKCGSVEQIQVDHIKSRHRFPELAMCIDNLQILCWPCNKEKSFRHNTDYRIAHLARQRTDSEITRPTP